MFRAERARFNVLGGRKRARSGAGAPLPPEERRVLRLDLGVAASGVVQSYAERREALFDPLLRRLPVGHDGLESRRRLTRSRALQGDELTV